MTSSSGTELAAAGGRAAAAVGALAALAVASVTFSVAVSSIAMVSAYLLLAWIAVRRGIGVIPRTGLEAAFLLYAAAEAVSSAFSVDPADSFTNSRRVLLAGVVYLAAFSFRTERKTLAALALLAGAGVVASVVEISSLRFTGGTPERASLFQISMTEGGVRMLIVLALIPFACRKVLPAGWRIALGGAIVVLFVALALNQTRSAWAGCIAGCLVAGTFRDRRVLAGLAAFLVVLAVLSPAAVRERALSVTELSDSAGFVSDSVTTIAESNVSRIQMIATGWRMFLDRPFSGWGDIGLRKYYVTYVEPLTIGEGGHLHNNLMEALVTLGVPGFLAVIWLFVMMLVVVLRAGRDSPRDSFRGTLATGLLAAYAGFHVAGLFEYNFGDHEVMVLVWFLTGLAAAAPAMNADGTGPHGASGEGGA